MVASGLDLKQGDQVIIETQAHPGGMFPFLNLWKKNGVQIQFFTPAQTAEENVNRIKALITSSTKLVQVSHITAPTGIVMPCQLIGQLCKQHNIWFHVDGAQSAGQLNFKIPQLLCNSYATSCHKWMASPFETGFLWIQYSDLWRVKPVEIGAYCESKFNLQPLEFDYFDGAQRFEYGTRDATKVQSLKQQNITNFKRCKEL